MKQIGNTGLLEALLIVNQGCSLDFEVIHKDDNGNVIDHTGSQGRLVIKNQSGRDIIADFSDYITCAASNILVSIPSEATKDIRPGEYVWDLIVTMQHGDVIRMLYGPARIVDTYSLDKPCRSPR